tara:strand:- start:10853 stop:11110 length:258 start_codon:yes stop_codon:yes gene_type:complete
MSKKEESVKLNADELVVIQELNQKFMQTKVAIADSVIQQQQLVAELSELQKGFKEQEKVLAEKYGENATINLQTGEVTQPEEKKE